MPRLLPTLALFLLLAAPSWPGTVDDVYITLGYARHWADTGVLEWTTGERVEGYSNFAFMAAMAALSRLGADLDLCSQLLAVGCGVAIIALAHRVLPRAPLGTIALLALATWSPLNHWSMVGMETTLFALLLAGGWLLALRRDARGMALLALAAISRPEGIAHVAVATALVGWRAWPALLALCAYHAARVAYFGAWLPTPILVKAASVGFTRHGLSQVAGDLVVAAGVLGATFAAGRASRRDTLWTIVPLALQSLVLWRASGDWMSWGRITMPGVVATVVAYASVATRPWGISKPPHAGVPSAAGRRMLTGLAVVPALAFALLAPRGYGTFDVQLRDLAAVARFPAHFTHGLDTPVAEDVGWAIDNVPTGARVLVVDAGMLGDIPGVHAIDMRGLTHRPAAEAVARGEGEAWLRDTLAADPPEFLRLATWPGEAPAEYPGWMLAPYVLRDTVRYGGGESRWYAVDHATPSASERAARWDEMLRRHPSQPFLWLAASRSAGLAGDPVRAESLRAAAASRWPRMAEFAVSP